MSAPEEQTGVHKVLEQAQLAVAPHNRGRWSEFLLLVLLGDHLGLWEIAAFTSGEMKPADVALILGAVGRLWAQFFGKPARRRESDA